MAVFRETAVRRFESAMARHVLSHYPSDAESLGRPEAVLAMIRRTIDYGRTLGFETERDLAALINLTAAYGEPFEEKVGDADIVDVLRDREIVPSSRIELVLQMLPED
jgi:hypothetical protein